MELIPPDDKELGAKAGTGKTQGGGESTGASTAIEGGNKGQKTPAGGHCDGEGKGQGRASSHGSKSNATSKTGGGEGGEGGGGARASVSGSSVTLEQSSDFTPSALASVGVLIRGGRYLAPRLLDTREEMLRPDYKIFRVKNPKRGARNGVFQAYRVLGTVDEEGHQYCEIADVSRWPEVYLKSRRYAGRITEGGRDYFIVSVSSQLQGIPAGPYLGFDVQQTAELAKVGLHIGVRVSFHLHPAPGGASLTGFSAISKLDERGEVGEGLMRIFRYCTVVVDRILPDPRDLTIRPPGDGMALPPPIVAPPIVDPYMRLLAQLRDADHTVRRIALRELCGLEEKALIETLEELFVDPDVRARLSAVDALQMLGGDHFPQGPRMLERVVKLLQDVDETVRLRAGYILGKSDQAVPRLEEELGRSRRSLPADNPDIARALSNLGLVLQVKGEYDRARPLLEEALNIRRRGLPADDPDIATSLSDLASVLKGVGQYDQALWLLEEALEGFRRSVPGNHPSVVACVKKLATLHEAKGDYDLAFALLEEVKDLQKVRPYMRSSLSDLDGMAGGERAPHGDHPTNQLQPMTHGVGGCEGSVDKQVWGPLDKAGAELQEPLVAQRIHTPAEKGGRGSPAAQAKVEALLQLTSSRDVDVRCKAIVDLVKLGIAAARHDGVVDKLMELLSDANGGVRSQAALALGTLGEASVRHHGVVEKLLGLLSDGDWMVRLSAVTALSKPGGGAAEVPHVVEALVELMKDPEEAVRFSAADALGKLGSAAAKHSGVVERLVELLGNPTAQIRSNAARILGSFGTEAAKHPGMLMMLVDLLRDHDLMVRRHAAGALRMFGEAAAGYADVVQALLELLSHRDGEIRSTAAKLLGSFGEALAKHPDVVIKLVELLRDPDGRVHGSAGEALGRLGEAAARQPEVMEKLVQLLSADHWWVVRGALDVLGKLGEPAANHAGVIEALLGLLMHPSDGTRRRATAVFGQLAGLQPDVVERLLALTQDADERVRHHAADALGELGGVAARHAEVAKALTRLMSDASEHVRQSAAVALERLSGGKQS